MTKVNESLIRSSMFILAISASINAINFFYHFISARMLGPEEYGIVASLFSIIYLMGMGATTVQNSVTKFTANFKAKKEYGKINFLFRKGTKKLLIYSAIIFLVYIGLSPFIADFLKIPTISVLMISPIIILFSLMPLNRGILQGLQKFSHLGWNMLIEGLIKLILLGILIYLGFKANGALAAVVIAMVIGYFLLFPFIRLGKKEKKFDTDEIYKFSFITLIALLLITAIYNMDIFLVKHFFDSVQAGHYAVLSLLGKIVFFGATAIGLVMFPKIAEHHQSNNNLANQLFKKSLIFAFLVALLITSFYFMFSDLIIKLIFGSAYLDISGLLGLFGIFMLFLSLSYICVLNKLALGRKKFILELIIAVLLEIGAIWLFHGSLSQVIWILITINALLFGALMVKK